MKEIYQQTVEEVLERVNGKKSGLTSEQVKRSREKCGWNELTEGKKKGILQIFFEQYKDFLVLILIASAIISGMLGDVESAAVIVTVITINAILGTIQTVKAEQSLQSLKNLSGPEAKVLRDGTVVQIPARELVVGDVILLEAGDMIPADGRLIENASLKIDESALTGESLAVEKNMDTILTEAPLGDRANMLFSGSFVTYGRGKAIVTDIGTQKMAKEHAIIRKLQAVEGLGSVSIICSDKTGTLTQNKMTVEDYYIDGKRISAEAIDISDQAQKCLLNYSILCNDSTNENGVEIGDPTETALINLGSRYGIEAASVRKLYPRNGELPFDSDRKMMSTLHLIDGKNQMIVKGAVDKLLERTEQIWTKEGIRKITEEDKEKIQRQNQEFSMEGLRVLAFTYREIPKNHTLTIQDEDHLVFLGLIAMMDPPREESKAAVAECIKAGIRPVMITGDHKITAAAIAKRVGILHDLSEACEGADIENMSDEELKEFVSNISVYARVSPEHKIRIVRAWQERGMIVAMTGDGVNDAPALKQADIGVAMGMTGTEVAKDAAAMVLTDDNFATIVKAVENGRNLYQNIKYAIQFLLSGNFGAILTVLCSSVAGLPVPFAPVHLLFINLLTDSLPAIALGLEPDRSEVMSEKPRLADESILTKDFLSKIGLEGLVIGAMTMISFLTGYNQNGTLLGSTYAFGTLCLARLFHGYNCKSDHPVIFTKGLFHNKWLQGAFVLCAVLITTVLTVPGFHNLFKVETLNLMQLGCVYLYAFASLLIIQLLKCIRMKLRKRGER